MPTTCKKLLNSHHSKSDHTFRIIYNSTFQNKHLFDPVYIKHLLKQPVVTGRSYSDVVKRKIVNSVHSSAKSFKRVEPNMEKHCTVKSNAHVKERSVNRVKYQTKRKTKPSIEDSIFQVKVQNKFDILKNEDVDSTDSVQTVSKRIPTRVSQNRLAIKVHKTKNEKVNVIVQENDVNNNSARFKHVLHRNHSHSVKQDVACRNYVSSEISCTKDKNVHSKKVEKTLIPDECKCSKNNVHDTKYDLGLLHVSKRLEKFRKAQNCKANAKFFKQNKGNFGYIPLSPLPTKITDKCNVQNIDVLEAHLLLKNDGRPNYAGLQIPVKSKINHEKLAEYLKDYWDWQLPLLVKFGFPLDIDSSKVIETDQINHKSALMFKEHVNHYIETEKKHKAILGPFDIPPFKLHTSPFLTRDKSSSDKRRVIVDLSWPLENSVNDAVDSESYLGTPFLLTLPTII